LPDVDVYDASTGAFRFQFQAFETGFTGGVRVAVGNVKGQDVIAAAAGPDGFLVRTFAVGPTGVTPLDQFEPFGTFNGGIWVALGDLNGDGNLEVVTGADAGGFPIVNVHTLNGQQISPNVMAFEAGFTGGVRVAVGDFSGTGQDDIAVGAGAGGLPFVQFIDGRRFAKQARFEVFGTGFSGGVFVAAGAIDASGRHRLVAGAGGQDGEPFDEPVLRAFDSSGVLLRDYTPTFEGNYHGGIDVATVSGFGQAQDVVLVAPAGTHAPLVLVYDSTFTALPDAFRVLDPKTQLSDANFASGAFVA
jgi:hypothetical protein